MAPSMLESRNQTKAFAFLALVMALWSGNYIVGRAVHEDVGPFMLSLIRRAGACLLLAPFAWRGLLRERAAILHGWKPILVLGVLGVGAFNTLLYWGLHYSTASNALLLAAAIPAAVVLFDRLLFGTRAGSTQLIAVGLSILGVIVIVFKGDPQAALSLRFGTGDLIMLAAVIVWAAYTVGLRLRPAVSPVSFLAATFLVGAACVAPFAAWEWSAGSRIDWSGGLVWAFAYVAVLPSLVAYFLYNWASGVVGAARAGQAITMMPLFGALLSALLLGELLHPYHWAGMALILAGIAVGALAARRQVSAGVRRAPPLEG